MSVRCKSCDKPLVVVDYDFDFLGDTQTPIHACTNYFCKEFLNEKKLKYSGGG